MQGKQKENTGRRRGQMLTIKDVAELAGVTPMTVSNVLRGRGRVGEATRQKVLQAVETSGYRPNLTARALVERRAPTLALLLGCITNPFYPQFTLQATHAARRHERHLLVCNTDYEGDGGIGFLAEVAGSLSDGILVANNGALSIEDLQTVQQGGTPVVISVWEFPDAPPPGIACVTFDSTAAGRIATEHLAQLGHQRIGAVVASEKGGIHNGRYDGYRSAMRAAHLRALQADVRFCSDDYQSGYDAATALLTARPDLTALFVSNDLPALGVLNAAWALGLRVPEDLSVVSITDIEQASQSRPALTTVAIPTTEMAEQGVNLLLQLIEERAGEQAGAAPVVHTAPPTLVTRASTAPPRRQEPTSRT